MSMFPKRRADVTSRKVSGETLILDRKHDEVHQLNQTASYIWACCDGKTSVSDMARRMAKEFGKEHEDVEPDVVGLIARFTALRLLEVD